MCPNQEECPTTPTTNMKVSKSTPADAETGSCSSSSTSSTCPSSTIVDQLTISCSSDDKTSRTSCCSSTIDALAEDASPTADRGEKDGLTRKPSDRVVKQPQEQINARKKEEQQIKWSKKSRSSKNSTNSSVSQVSHQEQIFGAALVVDDRKRKLIGDEFYTELSTAQPSHLQQSIVVSVLPSVDLSRQSDLYVDGEVVSSANSVVTPVTSASQLTNQHTKNKHEIQIVAHEEGVPLLYPLQLDDPTSCCALSVYSSSATLAVAVSDSTAAAAAQPQQHNANSSSSNSSNADSINAPLTPPFSEGSSAGMTDMAAMLTQAVKNEPEDLTGHRRDSPTEDPNGLHHVLKDSSKSLVLNHSGPPHSTSASITGHSDLSHFPVTTSEVGVNPNYVSVSANDFFSDSSSSGRPIYTGSEPFRPVSEPFRPVVTSDSPPVDLYHGEFARAGADVQYVQYHYKANGQGGQANHINSPDSGIGEPNITPTTPVVAGDGISAPFDSYPHELLNDIGGSQNGQRRPWQDFGRQNEEKIHIPKIFSPYGFRYILETPSSSSVRREDDKITYVNKGQFYGITLEYTPDPECPPLKSTTVKTIIMLVFREGKTVEEEVKAWQFWHSRQHSVKQRILDADTKNSMGLVGCIEEVSHNALAVYWNPLESPAKVNIAVQCLSTDFSTQKGVKGLPLHVQIDTFDDPRDSPGAPVYHRGYCQIKVFCDKGAERKARDEERRAAKRRMTTTGKRRLDEMYHQAVERSEFYSMADLSKPAVLFTPTDDPEKQAIEFGTELPSFYASRATPPETLLKINGNPVDGVPVSDAVSPHLLLPPPEKRLKLVPSPTERIMIYVRQETEDAYTALHLVPPSVPGLINAIESKYKINASNIRCLYRKSKQGIVAKIDDEMLRFYCNEDVFLMQVMVTEGPSGEDSMVYDITFSEC